MKTKFKSKLLSILLVLVMVLALVPVSAFTAFAAGGTEFVHFAIKEHWGVYFEQTGSNNLYPITLTNENKLSVPLPALYRTDYDGYVFDGWYIADTDTKVTQDTVFDGYTVVVDRWTFQEKDANTVISSIKVNNVALEAGMTTAEYNAAAQGATATVNGAPADAITADSAKTYTIYHGLNKSGDPLTEGEEVMVGEDYSVVTKIKLANGYTFDPNITFSATENAGMCASARFLGGADIYTKQWNTLATEVEVTINFMNTDYYFDQTPESRNLENYAQYKNWYTVSKYDGLESVTLQYESGGEWAVFIDNVPFEANGNQAGGYVTVSPYVNTTKTFRLVANYALGTVYSEPFEISWACLTPVIENVAIGVTAPMNGFAPQYTATTDSNRYTFKSENAETVKNGIKWTGSATGDLAVSDSKFNNDNDYTVSIKLVAQDGYTFANDVTATINANNANVSVVSDTEIRISYTFPKPEKTKWYVSFSTSPTYATGNMTEVQVEEGEYTLPEPTYTPYSGYEFVGWSVNGELKQPGDVITVSDNEIIEARWQSTVNDSPKGFTKQPPSKNTNAQGTVAIAGIGNIPYSFADDLTIDPSISYEYISVEFYDAESGEWVTELDGISVNYNAYVPTTINFNSNKAGTFTCRICAKKTVGGNIAISESFTVTWAAKQFTTQPQGDMVVVGDTVTVTADKNFYVEKYEIEYNDGGVWKLYQEKIPDNGWDIFSLGFTSDVAKSVTFRLKAYAEGDVYDEVNECWLLELIDTSEEFTITWTSNEHVHTYGAIPNGKDETNHWKECTDPACPDKAHSKIEVEAHKDNTADNKCDVCGYDLPVPEYIVSYNENGGSGTMVGDVIEKGGTFKLEACTYTAPEGKRFKAWAIGSVNGEQKQPNEQIIITAETYIYAIWEDLPHECIGVIESGQGATCIVDGWKDYYRCECGKYYEDANCQTPINDLEAWKVGAGKITAAHSGTPEWTKTATTHAKKYTCCDTFVVETEAHEWNNGTCSECGYVCLHTSVAVTKKDGQGATCTVDGWKDYYQCACGKYFADEARTTPISDLETWKANDGKILAKHEYGNLIPEESAVHTQTELKAGMKAHYKCSVCQGYFDENKNPTTEGALIIAKPEHSYGDWIKDNEKHWKVCSCGLKSSENTHQYDDNSDMICNDCAWDRTVQHTHGNGTKQDGQGATCTVNGWKDYYKCSCGKIYTDVACTNEITSFEEWKNGDGKIAAVHSYGDLIAKVDATCSATGMQAHFECSVCHTLFDADKAVKTENELTIAIDANAHTYGVWTSNGDGTHTRVCTLNAEHKENGDCAGGTATCTEKAVCATCNTAYGNTAAHSHGSEWKTDANEHWNECACGDKANKAAHTDSNNDGKCDTCEYQMSTTPDNPDDPGTTPPADNPPTDDDGGLGAGAIVGIVIGSVAVVGIGGFALFWFVIKKKSFADLIAIFKK